MSQRRTLFGKLSGQQQLSHQEILLSAFSALVAIAAVIWLSHQFLAPADIPLMVASMGASAVLLFAVPSSPMNRPWALVTSHIICAFIGVSCARYIPSLLVAAPVAVALSIAAMHYLRCLHPPGGATALLIVLGSPEVHTLGYQFIFTPIALNTVILLMAALLIQRIVSASRQASDIKMPSQWLKDSPHTLEIKAPFDSEDIKAAMGEIDTYIDVKESELIELYRLALRHYHHRHLGDLCCRDMMIANPVAAEYGTKLEDVWHWLEKYRLTALPVIDRANHVIGIVSVDDFIRHANELPFESLEARIKALITYTTALTSDKPEVVGQIMTSRVITAPQTTCIAKLLPIMDERDIHHIPIIDDNNKLVGVVSHDEILGFLDGNKPRSLSDLG